MYYFFLIGSDIHMVPSFAQTHSVICRHDDICKNLRGFKPELEFLKSLWGQGTEEE
jgi:hypothetical protein